MKRKHGDIQDHKYYSLSYRDNPLLHGVDGGVWEIDIEEARQRRDELDRVIEWVEENSD